MSLKPTGLSGYSGTLPAIVASGQQVSSVLNTGGAVLCGVLLPAALTSTALTFLTCDTADGTFVPVASTTDGTVLTFTVAQGTYCAVDPKDFSGIQFMQIKTGSAEGAARTLICSLKGF